MCIFYLLILLKKSIVFKSSPKTTFLELDLKKKTLSFGDSEHKVLFIKGFYGFFLLSLKGELTSDNKVKAPLKRPKLIARYLSYRKWVDAHGFYCNSKS